MNILLVVAHPDDEILGAGAFLSRAAREGKHIAVLTLGMTSATRESELSREQTESLAKIGIDARYEYGLDAMKFQEADRYHTVQEIEAVIKKEQPDWILTHYPEDLHNDHKITAGFVHEALRLPQRQTGYRQPIKRLLYMEIATSTDWSMGKPFKPNLYIGVEESDLEKKERALEVYGDVIRPVPHPRNESTIKALARYRGAQAGLEYAEAFMTAFEVKE